MTVFRVRTRDGMAMSRAGGSPVAPRSPVRGHRAPVATWSHAYGSCSLIKPLTQRSADGEHCIDYRFGLYRTSDVAGWVARAARPEDAERTCVALAPRSHDGPHT